MTERAIQEHYVQFLKEHRESICFELSNAYQKHYNSIRTDFGGYVFLPIVLLYFLIGLITGLDLPRIQIIFIGIALLVLLLWLYRYIVSLKHKFCKYFFQQMEYKEILLLYVRRCKNGALHDAESESDRSRIEQFYSFCEREISSEYFRY